jgi:predicted aspartyl protease
MVKVGINQLSVALLLDTGASDNYMSVRLVKSLGLLVRPDHRGIRVILADGHHCPGYWYSDCSSMHRSVQS